MKSNTARGELLRAFQQKIGFEFAGVSLLEEALTHSSYANEQNDKAGKKILRSNERLEFLGDAFLEFVSSEMLFAEHKDLDEGKLTRLREQLVCGESLSSWAKSIGLDKMLVTGKSTRGNISDAMLENAAEALFGAVFLDSGTERARVFVLKFLEEQKGRTSLSDVNPKTKLQELLQSKPGVVPYYHVLGKKELANNEQLFTVYVEFQGEVLAEGEGKSRKEAEFCAAERALKNPKLKNMLRGK